VTFETQRDLIADFSRGHARSMIEISVFILLSANRRGISQERCPPVSIIEIAETRRTRRARRLPPIPRFRLSPRALDDRKEFHYFYLPRRLSSSRTRNRHIHPFPSHPCLLYFPRRRAALGGIEGSKGKFKSARAIVTAIAPYMRRRSGAMSLPCPPS